MTFAPDKKTSKSRTGHRSSQWLRTTAKKLLDKTALQYDEAGNAIALAHFASPITGEYKGRKVISVGKKSRVKTIRA